jgi:hypothetical protein
MRFRTAPRWSPLNATHIVYSLIHMGSLDGRAKIWGGFHRRMKAALDSSLDLRVALLRGFNGYLRDP